MAWRKAEEFHGRTIYTTGNEFRVSLKSEWLSGFTKLEDIKQYILDYELKKVKNEKERHGKDARIPLQIALEEMMKGREAKGKNRKTFKPEYTYAKRLIDFFGGATLISSITAKQANDFFFDDVASPDVARLKDSSKNQLKIFFTTLRSFCDDNGYFHNLGFLSKIKFTKAKVFDNSADRISIVDLSAFLNAIEEKSSNNKWWTLFRLMAAYGLRPVEIRFLKRENWNSQERTLEIVESKVHKRNRVFKVVAELANEIDNILSSHDKETVFINGSGYHLGVNAIRNQMIEYMTKAGIPSDKYSPYSFRKFAARNLYLRWRDRAKVLHILGHSNEVEDVYYYFDKNAEDLDTEAVWWDFESERGLVNPWAKKESVFEGDKVALIVDLIKGMTKEEKSKIIAALLA